MSKWIRKSSKNNDIGYNLLDYSYLNSNMVYIKVKTMNLAYIKKIDLCWYYKTEPNMKENGIL